jgi:hypothetical protein
MHPGDRGAEGLRRDGSERCETARPPHPWLPETAAASRFAVHSPYRRRRAPRRAVGRGYAAVW